MITSQIEVVTPTVAEEMLKTNSRNRAVKLGVVLRYAEEMRCGRWGINGETIKVDENGTLTDGQHRLMACIQSGVSFSSLVVRGVPPESFETVDSGKSRGPGDVISILGVTNSKRVAAALNVIAGTKRGLITKSPLTNSTIIDELHARPEVEESVRFISNLTGSNKAGFIPNAIGAGLHYVFAQKDKVLADMFFETLFNGENIRKGDPIFVLRSRLITEFMRTPKPGRMSIAAWIITTWNAVRLGREIKILKFDRKVTPKLPEIK